MQIQQFKPQNHFVKCVIYGGSGVGKTVFGGTAPSPLFASSEDGLLSVVSTLGYSPDFVKIDSIEVLQQVYEHLKNGDHNYKTLVIDSLTEINEMIKENLEKKVGRSLQIKEWGEISRTIKGIIKGIKSLPLHVIIICQEKIVADEDKIDQKVPMLNGKNATSIAYIMDIVGYMYLDKATERHITTRANNRIVSKDRSGKIGHDAPLDFKEWVNLISTMEIREEPRNNISPDLLESLKKDIKECSTLEELNEWKKQNKPTDPTVLSLFKEQEDELKKDI